MPEQSPKCYLLKELEEIHVEGQYGVSFRATVTRELDAPEPQSVSQKRRIEAFLPVHEKLCQIEAQKTYFIKCPDPIFDKPKQEEFVLKEFDNGSSINHAADRSLQFSSNEKGDKFTINRMIGKAVLCDPQRVAKNQPCLIYEYAGDPKLTNQTLAMRRPQKFKGSAKDFLKFANKLANVVRVLHNQGIVHTFLVPRNIIVGTVHEIAALKAQFTLVGFGYARHNDTAGRNAGEGGKGSAITVSQTDRQFRAPECGQIQTHAAFGYPADIYSIGAIFYSLLLGPDDKGIELLKDPPKDTRLLKRRIANYLNKAQGNLLKEHENILKIIDTSLRYEADSRYSCVEELIESIQIALRADPKFDSHQEEFSSNTNRLGKQKSQTKLLGDDEAQKDFIKALLTHDFARHQLPQYFSDLKHNLAIELGQDYARLGRGHFEVYGHRDRIVTSLCRLLGCARQGDLYRTMTLPDYWTDANLGSLGRFLTMNKHMARRGVRIERLFLVSQDFHNLPEEEQFVLEEQYHAAQDLKENLRKFLSLRVLTVPEEEIADFERNGELVAYLQERPGVAGEREPLDIDFKNEQLKHVVCLNFFSTAKEEWSNGRVRVHRTIKKIRYWNPQKVHRTKQFIQSVKRFKTYWDTAEVLENYIYQQKKFPNKIRLQTIIGSKLKQQCNME
jgi:serine/threonine protein kinase